MLYQGDINKEQRDSPLRPRATLPSEKLNAMVKNMDRLEQLETAVVALLEKNERLTAEVTRLNAEAETAAAEKSSLEAENRQLQEALTLQEQKRDNAVQRIDALLQIIQEHENNVAS